LEFLVMPSGIASSSHHGACNHQFIACNGHHAGRR
jgi:hypothetical protein